MTVRHCDQHAPFIQINKSIIQDPAQYFANTQQPSTPRRTGPLSRPVSRSSDIDFDQVPSPRPPRKSASGPGPSNLSKSLQARDLQQDSDPPDNDAHDHGGMDDNGAFEDYGQPDGGSPQDSPLHQTSFTQMDKDDDGDDDEGDDEGEEQQQQDDHQAQPPPARRNKGKERVVDVLPDVPEEEEEDLEEEIVQGMQDVEQQHDDDDGEEDHIEPDPRRNKKAKVANEEARKPRQPRGKSKKENRGKYLFHCSTSIWT
jgi:centromere protein C